MPPNLNLERMGQGGGESEQRAAEVSDRMKGGGGKGEE